MQKETYVNQPTNEQNKNKKKNNKTPANLEE